jgi:YegS/Rv2252/BmrU family lipid kinase
MTAWQVWLTVVGGTLGVSGWAVAVVTAVRLRRVTRTMRTVASVRQTAPLQGAVVIVANPSKAGMSDFRALAIATCHELDLGNPVWLETTAESPGSTQTTQALAQHPNARVVIAAGGDGTVRAVAHGLANTSTPLGIVPIGTANLLARNLALPLGSTKAALKVALTGQVRPIDVGRISTWDSDGAPLTQAQAFLVIAGLGFDAEMVSTADSRLKARLGWPAYFISGINHLAAKPVKVRLTVGSTHRAAQARAVMFGNCGVLPAGLQLVPDADLADGLLDLAMAETRHGLMGWAALAMQVLAHGVGLRWVPAWTSGRMWYEQSPRFAVDCDRDYKVQLDGELVGSAGRLEVWVDPLALRVRVPASSRPGGWAVGQPQQDPTGH